MVAVATNLTDVPVHYGARAHHEGIGIGHTFTADAFARQIHDFIGHAFQTFPHIGDFIVGNYFHRFPYSSTFILLSLAGVTFVSGSYGLTLQSCREFLPSRIFGTSNVYSFHSSSGLKQNGRVFA